LLIPSNGSSVSIGRIIFDHDHFNVPTIDFERWS
jgi:hypothetical protein